MISIIYELFVSNRDQEVLMKKFDIFLPYDILNQKLLFFWHYLASECFCCYCLSSCSL